MLNLLFPKRKSANVGADLYAAVVAQARQPTFFTDLGVEDRIDARFELYTLHALLLILRLRDHDADGGAGQGADAAQALFDHYVSALDNVLRELGVGDVSMARKMRSLGEALYGRMRAYEQPLREEDADALAPLLARNVYSDEAFQAVGLARYSVVARRCLAEQTYAQIVSGPRWPEII